MIGLTLRYAMAALAMGAGGTRVSHAALDLARGSRGAANPRRSEREKRPERGCGRREVRVTRSLIEVSVAVAASTIMVLMVAVGGAALEWAANAPAPGTELTGCQPPLAWREPACKPPLAWREPD
jgi:hypothetical protein